MNGAVLAKPRLKVDVWNFRNWKKDTVPTAHVTPTRPRQQLSVSSRDVSNGVTTKKADLPVAVAASSIARWVDGTAVSSSMLGKKENVVVSLAGQGDYIADKDDSLPIQQNKPALYSKEQASLKRSSSAASVRFADVVSVDRGSEDQHFTPLLSNDEQHFNNMVTEGTVKLNSRLIEESPPINYTRSVKTPSGIVQPSHSVQYGDFAMRLERGRSVSTTTILDYPGLQQQQPYSYRYMSHPNNADMFENLPHQAVSSVYGHDGLVSNDMFTDVKPPVDDLSLWVQQKQRMLQQQQNSFLALTPSMTSSSLSHSLSQPMSASHVAEWQQISEVVEKQNAFIERCLAELRSKDLQLQSQNSLSASTTSIEVPSALLRKAQIDNAGLRSRIQELEHTNQSLKSQLASVQELQKQLGKTEYELEELKKSNLRTRTENADELKIIQQKVSEKEQEAQRWKKLYDKEVSDRQLAIKDLNTVQQYLTEMPSKDEIRKKADEQLKTAKTELETVQLKLEQREMRIVEMNRKLQSMETLVETLEGKETQLNLEIEKLKLANTELTEKVALLKSNKPPGEDIDELKKEIKNLTTDLEKAKKMLTIRQKQLREQETAHREAMDKLKDALHQEESTVIAMRHELTDKEEQINKLTQRVKQLSTENQNMLSRHVTLEARVRELENEFSAEVKQAEQLLLVTLGICCRELSNMVELCEQRAQGSEVNVALLFSRRDSMMPAEMLSPSDTLLSLQQKTKAVEELRSQIGVLHSRLTTLIAEDLGDKVSCAMQ